MEVNAKEIKGLRASKGWTQQHLADACAISLRTVQRVERYGNASHETLLSLAAVFNVDQASLQAEEVLVEMVGALDENTTNNIKVQLVIATAFGALVGALAMYCFQ